MESRVRIESIDGNLVLRIPECVAAVLGYEEGLEVKLTVARRRRRLMITRLSDDDDIPTLEDLLSRITEENRHPEVDWGPPVGNEVW